MKNKLKKKGSGSRGAQPVRVLAAGERRWRSASVSTNRFLFPLACFSGIAGTSTWSFVMNCNFFFSLQECHMDFDLEKIQQVKMLVMDVDGIMTDSRILMDANGEWKRFFSVRDGLGILSVQKAGYATAVITGANSIDVRKRMEHLKINHFFENKSDKTPAYNELKALTGFEDREICYIGDDLPDLPLLKVVGFSATVPEAVEDVRKQCDYITAKQGGYGAVRELCDLIVRNGSHRKL